MECGWVGQRSSEDENESVCSDCQGVSQFKNEFLDKFSDFRVNPDIVFLQEVVQHEIGPIDALRSLYDIFYANPGAPYETAILVSKFFQTVKHETVFFTNSGMHRCLQILEGKIGDLPVFLMNTHLESMKDHSAQRSAQFKECMDKARELIDRNPGCMLFYGGDLNLRDKEATTAFPNGVKDAWESAGKAQQTRYTWNMRLNDNHNKDGFNKAAMRYLIIFFILSGQTFAHILSFLYVNVLQIRPTVLLRPVQQGAFLAGRPASHQNP